MQEVERLNFIRKPLPKSSERYSDGSEMYIFFQILQPFPSQVTYAD